MASSPFQVWRTGHAGQSLPLLSLGSDVLASEECSGLHSLCPGAFSLCLLSGLPGSWFGSGVLAPELILYLGLKQGFLLPPRPCPKDFSTVLAPAHSSFPPLSTAAGCQVLTVHLRTALQGAGAERQQPFPPALSLLPLRLSQDRRWIPCL